MKKLLLVLLLVAVTAFQFCSSSKKAQAATAKTTYAAHVQPLIQNSCSPCHIPPQGKVTPLNTYETAKAEADEMIDRIGRNPGDKGFMPLKHPKLPDSTIAVFVRWKADGLLEK